MFDLVSNNALISSLVGAAIIGLIGLVWKARRDKADGNRIYQFLLASKAESEFKFRSTEAIASNTGLSEERVAHLCAKHCNIRRNEKEKQSWTLAK